MSLLASDCSVIVKKYATALASRKSFFVNTSGLNLDVISLLNAIKLIITFNYCHGNLTIIDEYRKVFLSVPLALEINDDHEKIMKDICNEFTNGNQGAALAITGDNYYYFNTIVNRSNKNIKYLEYDFDLFIDKLVTRNNECRYSQ